MHEILTLAPICGVYDREMFDEYIELSQKTLDIYTGHDSKEDDDGDEVRFDEFIKLLKKTNNHVLIL